MFSRKFSRLLNKSVVLTTLLGVVFWSLGPAAFIPTAQAAATVTISPGTINANFAGAPVKASSAATAIAKIAVTASTTGKTLTGVQVNFSGTNFNTNGSDLAALATGATSGVALYNDDGGTAGSFDGTDTVVTLAANPAYIANTTNIILTPATPVALTNGVAVNFFVVIKTSGTAANGDRISALIPASGVTTNSDGSGPTNGITIPELAVDTVAPVIQSVFGFAGSTNVTVNFAEPVQKVGGGALATGDSPLVYVDGGGADNQTISSVTHTAGQGFATVTMSANLNAEDVDASPANMNTGSNKIADMAGNVMVSGAVNLSSPLNITTPNIPAGVPGTVYSSGSPLVAFVASGGTTPYTFAPNAQVDTDKLTSLGLVLATDGKLTGTLANLPGGHQFTLKVTDSTNPTPVVVTRSFTINVQTSGGGAPPGITHTSPGAVAQSSTNTSVTISGSNTAFSSSSTVSFPLPPGTAGTPGVTVNSVTFVSATQLTANITVAANATAGSRDVVVTTGTQVVVGPNLLGIFEGGASGLALFSPSDAATNIQLPHPSFNFNASTNTSVNSYRITVASASDFATKVWDYVFPKPSDGQNSNGSHCNTMGCNLTYGSGQFLMITQPVQLTPDTTYYWRVSTYSEQPVGVSAAPAALEATASRSFRTTASVSDFSPPTISHRPVFQATASTNLVMFARVIDNLATKDTNPALTAKIFYCAGSGCTPTTSADAIYASAGYFTFTIPSATISTANTIVRYYLQASDGSNTQNMYQTGTTPFQLTSVAAGSATIAGTVKDSADACPAAVQGARVFAEGTGFNATTNGSCVFSISGVIAGAYDLVAIKEGYGERFISGVASGSTGIPFKLGAGFTGGFGGDTTKPRVKFTMPGDEMQNVPGADSNFRLAVVFDKAMSQNSITTSGNLTVNEINLSTGALTNVTANGSWAYYPTVPQGTPLPPEAQTNVAVWTLTSPNTLGDNKTIAIVVSNNVTDTSGNPIQGNQPDGSYASTFRTGSATFTGTFSAGQANGAGAFIPPHVNGTTPTPGTAGVPTNTKVVIDFSEAMADDGGTYLLKNFVKLFTVAQSNGTETETDVSSTAIDTVTLASSKMSVLFH